MNQGPNTQPLPIQTPEQTGASHTEHIPQPSELTDEQRAHTASRIHHDHELLAKGANIGKYGQIALSSKQLAHEYHKEALSEFEGTPESRLIRDHIAASEKVRAWLGTRYLEHAQVGDPNSPTGLKPRPDEALQYLAAHGVNVNVNDNNPRMLYDRLDHGIGNLNQAYDILAERPDLRIGQTANVRRTSGEVERWHIADITPDARFTMSEQDPANGAYGALKQPLIAQTAELNPPPHAPEDEQPTDSLPAGQNPAS